MITAVYVKAPDVIGLSVSGHAGAAPIGQDIVCAYVSGIIESLRVYLLQCPYCTVRDEDDVLTMSATVLHEPAFDMAAAGLMAVSEQYPEYVSFSMKAASFGGEKRAGQRRKPVV